VIERFNFYDVYGYLLPGLAVLAVLGFPLLFVAGKRPSPDWSSAILVLVLGYVVGLIVARIGQQGLRHETRDAAETFRRPSDHVLDNADTTFTTVFKDALAACIRTRFGLNVRANGHPTADAQTAFFLCRGALLQHDTAGYAEQFEGMYTMSRGLCVAAAILSTYTSGWAFAPWFIVRDHLLSLVVAATAVVLWGAALSEPLWRSDQWPGRERLFGLFVSSWLPLGAVVGARLSTRSQAEAWQLVLVCVAVTALLLAVRFYNAYRYFAHHFAVTVYRDFYALEHPARANAVKA
jgi:hypothetical protein